MTTTKTPAEIKAEILAGFAMRKTSIETVNPARGSYVLMWNDGIRFVGFDTNKKPVVVGFERAALFGDREAATVWTRKGLTDGAHISPEPVLAFNGKQHALAALGRAYDQVAAL